MINKNIELDVTKDDIYDEVVSFLSEELEVDKQDISPETHIINDLDGDSMLFLEMIDEFKSKFDIDIEVRFIGRYFMANPVYTVGETVEAIYFILYNKEKLIEMVEAQNKDQG